MKSLKSYYLMLIKVVNTLAVTSGKNKLFFMFDIIWCTLIYGASPNNYLCFDFYKLNHSKRRTYVTHRVSERMIGKYNNDAFRNIFEDKTLFAESFKDYFGREWVSFKDLDLCNFKSFAEGKKRIIFKQVDSAQGQGIEVINTSDFKDGEEVYHYLIEKHGINGIIEDWIQQHEEISNIYSRSVNPVRIITVLQNSRCNFLIAGLTIGNSNEISNASCNDMVAPIDISKGIIKLPASDYENIYSNHPETGMIIQGFKIPYWEEMIELVEKASKVVPEIGYVGWDVAITPSGPILIEGNTSPGYKFYQIPCHMLDEIGNRPIYGKFL